MKDILEEIQALQEKFKNLYRTKDGEVGLRFVDGTPQFKAVFQGPDVPKLHRLTDLERARKAQEYRMKHSEYDPEDGMVYHEPPEEEKKPIHNNNKPEARLPKGDKKMNDNNSYDEILNQILTLKEDFMNLIEVEGLGDPSNEVPPSTNKIKKDRKTKDGKVEVVSVEDELFPYDGNKREQYRQKILDTINNMIQGTATLEDLLQIVRQKKMPVKEGLEKAVEILEEEIKKERKNNKQRVYRRMDDPEKNKIGVKKNYNRVIHNDSASKDPAFDYVKIKGTKYGVDKYGQIGAPLKEAIELTEELLLERNKENRDKKEKWELKTNNITKKYKKAIQDYAKQEGDEAKYHRAAAADYDHIYSQQPAQAPDGSPNSVAAYFNGKYQEMLRNKGRNEQNIADEVEPLTKKLKNRKHSFHDRVRGWTESEALKEAMELMEDLLSEASPFAVKRRIADKFKDKMDDKFHNAYGEVKKTLQKMNDVDKEVRAKGGETVAFTGDKITDFSKDPEVKKKQEEFNKATDDMHKASAKCDKVHHLRNLVQHYQTPEMADEALREAKELLEGLFINDGRGDLLDDVSKTFTGNTIGQNIKKVAQGITKKVKQK